MTRCSPMTATYLACAFSNITLWVGFMLGRSWERKHHRESIRIFRPAEIAALALSVGFIVWALWPTISLYMLPGAR